MAERLHTSRVLAGLTGLPRAFVVVGDRDPNGEAEGGKSPSPIELALEQGRQEGLKEGAARAIEAQRLERDALLSAISESVASLVDLRATITRRHEQAMLDLALAAASRMLRDKIDQNDPVAARALREALAALPESGRVQVRLHPDDIDSVRRDLAREIAAERVVLTADATIGRGGCVVDCDAGSLDATRETALVLVEETVRGTDTP